MENTWCVAAAVDAVVVVFAVVVVDVVEVDVAADAVAADAVVYLSTKQKYLHLEWKQEKLQK